MTRYEWFQSAVCVATGAYYAIFGAALLLDPGGFLVFPSGVFNRHSAVDLGCFLLPLGLGLLIAARQPSRFRALIVVAASASTLHFFNHSCEGLSTTRHKIADFAFLPMALLLFGTVEARKSREPL